MPLRSCRHCNKFFRVKPSSKIRFCSIGCFNRSPYRGVQGNRDMERICAHCGKTFRRHAGHTKQRFCSKKCSNVGREWRPTEIGKQFELRLGLRINKRAKGKSARSVRHAYKTAFPFCQRCGWHEEPAILHIHHRDGNRRNNTMDNFESLCPNCHVLHHYRCGDSIWGKIKP